MCLFEFWIRKKKGTKRFLSAASGIADIEVQISVRPSVRRALPQGTCELPYQYRGHFSRPESLIGIFRQVTMIIRDKILRFAEKFEKKIFATSFFRTKIYLCLSELKKTPSIKILRALWLVCPSWHTWPVSANENRENRPATKWVRPRMRNWSRHVFPSMSAETEDLSRIIPIWSHLDQNKVSTFVIAQPFCSSDNVLCTCPNFELLEPQFIVVFGDFIFLPGINPESLVFRQITQIWIVFKTSGCLLLLLWKWKLSNWKFYFSPCCISCVWC